MSGPVANIVFGVHAVSRLLATRPERIARLYLASHRDDAATRLIEQSARDDSITTERVDRARLEKLAHGGKHQGVVAEIEAAPLLDENGLLDLLDKATAPLLLALDGVQDPHNLGACLRTAEAAGCLAVIVPRDRAVGLTAGTRKAAAGAAEFIPLAQVTNLARTLRSLKQIGIWCYGAASGEGTALYAQQLTGPVCLVLGGEAQGLRRLTREQCDGLFHIPMSGGAESLNVSVAAGICLFEAQRQRLA